MKKWEVFDEFLKLHDKVNKIFDSQYPQFRLPGVAESSFWRPDADIYEDNDKYTVFVDLPGVDKNNINLKVEDSTLTVKVERKYDDSFKSDNFIRSERKMGEFYRSFHLPSNCKRDGIKAKFDAGVLEIVIFKEEKKKSKEVKIELK